VRKAVAEMERLGYLVRVYLKTSRWRAEEELIARESVEEWEARHSTRRSRGERPEDAPPPPRTRMKKVFVKRRAPAHDPDSLREFAKKLTKGKN
jgi:hypothetical protein